MPQKIEDIEAYLKELARVIKPGGKIFIGEYYTPGHKLDWLREADYSQYGLEKKVYVGEDELVKLLGESVRYELAAADPGAEKFFIVLTKKAKGAGKKNNMAPSEP